MKQRKNFVFDAGSIKSLEKIAKKNKRSLTKQVELLIEKCIAEDGDEFFAHMDKRHSKL